MKKLSFLLLTALTLLGLAAGSAQARAIDTDVRALQVRDNVEETVMAMKGVNGTGVTGCDPRTGKAELRRDFVHCLSITTESKATAQALRVLFPVGAKIDGVFVNIENIGHLETQPRMSAGSSSAVE